MEQTKTYDFDFFVIGGGSGGLASSKAAASLGAKVGLADFVKPSTQGTVWGLGGTCVNVGCIPKKLMHFASILGELREDQKETGFQDTTKINHNWNEMLDKVNNHIRSLNWNYKSALAEKGVEYFNSLASIVGPNTIELTKKDKSKKTITSKYILLATGGRPSLLNIPGAKECCITSDDLFWQQKPPGKCLLIGAGYIGLECGGFLRGMGYEVDILHRSRVLRGFDDKVVQNIVDYMTHVSKIKFVEGNPVEFVKVGEKIQTTWTNNANQKFTDEYDTVLMAVGRTPDLKNVGLENLGVKVDKSGKIMIDSHFQSSIPGVFAIGDIVSEGKELTPVAIKQGIYLAEGLFSNNWKTIDMRSVATTVFTPLEYGCSGYTEEEAVAACGADNVAAYINEFTPVEWNLNEEKKKFRCLAKILVHKKTDQILGIHFTGPNAGEVIQGLSVGVRLGLKFADLQETIGVDSTCGSVLLNMRPHAISDKKETIMLI